MAEAVLGAVIAQTGLVMISVYVLQNAATSSSVLSLLIGTSGLAASVLLLPMRARRAVRRARRRWERADSRVRSALLA